MEEFRQIKETALPMLVNYGLNIVGAIAIFIVGWLASKWVARRVEKFSSSSKRIDATLAPLFVTATRILVLVITLLTVLAQFGVETASIVALLGTVGLAIGLALQGTLSNIASGIMLLILRPFNVGDVVDINGTVAVVDEIGLFITELHNFNNIYIAIPNSRVWGDKVENYTRNPTRRVDMEFGIHYDDSIDQAMEIIHDELKKDERVLAEPAPLVEVGTLADSSVNIFVRPWTVVENVWPLRFHLTKKIKQRFDEGGITIPFPQRDVHQIAPAQQSAEELEASK